MWRRWSSGLCVLGCRARGAGSNPTSDILWCRYTSKGHLSPFSLGYLAKDSERYCQNDKGSHAIFRLYGPLRRPMSYVIVVPRQCVITIVSCLDVIAHGTELVRQGNNMIVSAMRHVWKAQYKCTPLFLLSLYITVR